MSTLFGFPEKPAGSGGDFLPIVKFDARSGLLFRIDATQSVTGWERKPVEITKIFAAIADLENLEVGWIDFMTGGAPSFVVTRFIPGTLALPQPNKEHKQGSRMTIKLAKACGGDVRTLSGNSQSWQRGIEALYRDYDAQKAANPGRLPVIVLTGSMPVVSGKGMKQTTNFQPQFSIVNWMPRPADMPVPTEVLKAQSGNGLHQASLVATPADHDFGAPSTGAQRAEPPRQAPQQPAFSPSDFG